MDVEQAIIRGFSEACAKLHALMAAEEKLFHYNLSPSEVHCIVMIDRLDSPNVTELAKALHMTPGGVSKLTARLSAMKAIERFHKEHNRKEVFFRLTPLGEEIKTATRSTAPHEDRAGPASVSRDVARRKRMPVAFHPPVQRAPGSGA